MSMQTRHRNALYQFAKALAKPFGLYPFPRTHMAHLRHVFRKLEIDCVFDVGAHFGEFGKSLRDMGYRGEILSFEPVSASLERLRSAARGDPKWKVFPYALGSAEGPAEINLFLSSDFNSLLTAVEGADRFSGSTQPVGREVIEVRRLDSIFDQCTAHLPPESRILLKMDTQGYDLFVFEGAAGVLDRITAIQSELPAIHHYQAQPSMLSAMSVYWQSGFRPTAFFPLSREVDDLTVMEWDCILARDFRAQAPGTH
jgi:FkbM family methyltransferase